MCQSHGQFKGSPDQFLGPLSQFKALKVGPDCSFKFFVLDERTVAVEIDVFEESFDQRFNLTSLG